MYIAAANKPCPKFKLTPNQREYELQLCFGEKALHVVHGIAGTGKTSIACKSARFLLKKRDTLYNKLVITQPITTVSNEQLGYLPGSLFDKTQPWSHTMASYLENTPYEFVALGHMRGLTWDNTVILADEMQNSTKDQMKTLLTRVGIHSKLIIMGDLGQQDISGDNGMTYLHDDAAAKGLLVYLRKSILRKI